MPMTGIHATDFGYAIDLRMVQDGVAQDISSYTTKTFFFLPPGEVAAVEKTAIFKTNGVDGWLRYIVEEDFIADPQTWKVYAQVTKVGGQITSDPVNFFVKTIGV